MKLDYTFRDTSLLKTALTHRSYANEHREAGIRDNERLEFLGDSVLGLICTKFICSQYKNLPEGEVLDIYNSGIYEIESYYESYGYSAYGTVDSFACTYLGLSSGSDWRAYIRQQAEYQVKQMLVFYYVTQQENFIPTEEEYKTEYEKTYNEMFDSYLASKEFKREDYDSEEKYQSALEGHKKTFAAYYGADYFRETVYYRFGLERIKDFANIIEK